MMGSQAGGAWQEREGLKGAWQQQNLVSMYLPSWIRKVSLPYYDLPLQNVFTTEF